MTQSDTLLAAAVEAVRALNLPACIKDSALRYHFVNDAYCRLMRRPAADMIGWGSYQLTGKIEDLAREDKERQAIVFGTEEAIACHIDGTLTPQRLHCERFITEDETIYLYEVFEQQIRSSMDVDWQKREQELLDAKAERDALIAEQESLLSGLPFGVLLLNPDRVFEYVNETFYEIWDVDRKIDLKGQTYRDYLKHNYHHGKSDYGDLTFEELYAERILFFDGAEQVDTREQKTVNGRVLQITKNRLAGGRVLLTVTDITAMREREAELASLLARAEAADQAKSEFLANMSHEIRTPMNGVLGMAELLSRSGLNARQKTFTDVIVKSANALLTIINDILDFSKLDAGEMQLVQSRFQPSEAVEDVASLLIAEAQDKGVELIVDIKPEALITVMGDAGRFRQIAINLIGNAVKFTERGHVLVELSLTSHGEDSCDLILTVSDSGIGIEPDNLNSIFEKFHQAGKGNIRRHEGTGLGLSITAGLVHLFGGKITATSTVNVGTRFHVTLPTTIDSRQTQSPIRRFDGTRPSVLTIGGSDIGHRILLEQLMSWGIDAHHAIDAEMGLAILREAQSIGFQIDAVLIDHHFGAPDDIKIAYAIRQNQDLRNIGVILISDLARYGQQPSDHDQSIDLVLSRPVRHIILQHALSELILEKGRSFEPAPTLSNPKMMQEPRPDILIAEDNEVNQIVFSQILKQYGLSFRIVENGNAAFEAWQRQRPSLILMDIEMPQMDGFEATRSIRHAEMSEGLGRRVPIIAVSAHTVETERDQCLEAGMDDFIAKPVSPEVLIGKISQWLHHQLDDAERKSAL